MATESADATIQAAASVRRLEPPSSPPGHPAQKFRLSVLALSVDDVVRSAGGWLYDRAVMGWDVTVAVAEPADDRPLHILGARMVELGQALRTTAGPDSPDALSVAVGFYQCDPRVQRLTLKAISRPTTEVTLWGADCPGELGRLRQVEHQLSGAAQAFKMHAVTAAGVSSEQARTAESFLICRRHTSPMSGTPDLLPAS